MLKVTTLLLCLCLLFTTVLCSIKLDLGVPRSGAANMNQNQEYYLDVVTDSKSGDAYLQCEVVRTNGVGAFNVEMKMGKFFKYNWPISTSWYSVHPIVTTREAVAVEGRWYITVSSCYRCSDWGDGVSNYEITCSLEPFENNYLKEGTPIPRRVQQGQAQYFYFDIYDDYEYPVYFELNVTAERENSVKVSYSKLGYPGPSEISQSVYTFPEGYYYRGDILFNNQPQISSLTSSGRYYVKVETCTSCAPNPNVGDVGFEISYNLKPWGNKETRLTSTPIYSTLGYKQATYFWIDVPKGFYSLSITAHNTTALGQYVVCLDKDLPVMRKSGTVCTSTTNYRQVATLDYIPSTDEFGKYIIGVFQCYSGCGLKQVDVAEFAINATFLH